jgi:succinate dehydrogenase / fumarate reductase flavoprotein subunit
MLHALYQRNVKANTQFFVEWMALDLIRDEEGHVLGVTAMEMETGEVVAFHAKATIFATGGAGRIFYSSTNAFINTGDGLGMAARAGIPLEDMEFWQFHPTGVAGAGVLITEGVRGEGGILRNSASERFMERYAPNAKDLASRDVVSRAMVTEINEGRGCGPNKDYVLLDITHLRSGHDHEAPAGHPRNRRSSSPVSIADQGTDCRWCRPATTRWAVFRPTTRARSWPQGRQHEQPVPGFYAAGECACASVHGANRLGTNSLLDLLVFGKSAGDSVVEDLKGEGSPQAAGKDAPTHAGAPEPPRYADRRRRRARNASGHAAHHAEACRRVPLQGHAGRRGVERFSKSKRRSPDRDQGQVAGLEHGRIEALELDNLIEVAKATMISAEARKESRGAHVRDDAPDTAGIPERPRRQGTGSSTRCGTRRQSLDQLQAGEHEAADRRNHRAQDALVLIGVQNEYAKRTMQFKIYRYDPDKDDAPYMQDISVEVEPTDRKLLDALTKLKAKDDTMSYRRSCREGVCGSDAMNINGKNGLACLTDIDS